MEVPKTDLLKAIAYLDDAASVYKTMPKPKHQWRAVLMKRLADKFKLKLKPNNERDK